MARRTFEHECDGPLIHVGGPCQGDQHDYSREARSFGVPFMTSARLCGLHRGKIAYWRNAPLKEAVTS